MRTAMAAAALVTAWILLFLDVAPVPTWFYVFAWYPTLVLLYDLSARLHGGAFKPAMRSGLSCLAWSPVIWLLFEAANFRLENWYYVFLPSALWERWIGIVLSFATVLPALFLAERVLAGAGVLTRAPGPPLRVRDWELNLAIGVGVASTALWLLMPRLFFPLIWGAVFFIVDPWVFRRAPELSLIGDLTRGYYGRIGRLLLGGGAIGLLWEWFNYWARGKWIYTVPWLEHLKLFEMPPLGFLGFPLFALEAWGIYSALRVMGIAAPGRSAIPATKSRLFIAVPAALVFGGLTLLGMERYTISSVTPTLAELPGLSSRQAAELNAAGVHSVFELATLEPDSLASSGAMDLPQSRRSIETARLATLRGIGAAHARVLHLIGVADVCTLAARDPEPLVRAYRQYSEGPRPTEAEVRIWVRAATRHCTL